MLGVRAESEIAVGRIRDRLDAQVAGPDRRARPVGERAGAERAVQTVIDPLLAVVARPLAAAGHGVEEVEVVEAVEVTGRVVLDVVEDLLPVHVLGVQDVLRVHPGVGRHPLDGGDDGLDDVHDQGARGARRRRRVDAAVVLLVEALVEAGRLQIDLPERRRGHLVLEPEDAGGPVGAPEVGAAQLGHVLEVVVPLVGRIPQRGARHQAVVGIGRDVGVHRLVAHGLGEALLEAGEGGIEVPVLVAAQEKAVPERVDQLVGEELRVEGVGHPDFVGGGDEDVRARVAEVADHAERVAGGRRAVQVDEDGIHPVDEGLHGRDLVGAPAGGGVAAGVVARRGEGDGHDVAGLADGLPGGMHGVAGDDRAVELRVVHRRHRDVVGDVRVERDADGDARVVRRPASRARRRGGRRRLEACVPMANT